MNVDTARGLLADADPDDGPMYLPGQVFAELERSDLPAGVRVGVGELKEGVTHVEWDGTLVRDDDRLFAEVEQLRTRKYWYAPLNVEQYLDLVRRAVDTRERLRGDVRVVHHDDDGAYVNLTYEIDLPPVKTLRDALDAARAIDAQLHEEADRATDDVGRVVANVARRVDAWATSSLSAQVSAVETATNANAKGRALEELATRLLETVPGFTISGRGRTITETEEIDIVVVNGCAEPQLSREGSIILAECKNWSTKCGKNEFVVFLEKIRNRSERATLGLLVSWNGFADTVKSEMLRGTRERGLIVPIDGKRLRAAAADGVFLPTLLTAWHDAVML